MLRTRIWTALVALPVLLALIVAAPGWLFAIFVAAFSALGLYEIGLMSGARRPTPILASIAAGASPCALMLYNDRGSRIAAISVIAAMLALIAHVAISGADGDREGTPLTVLGALYVGVLFPYFALLRNRPGGINLLILMLLLVVASDTGAYFAGKLLGSVRLASKVSPNKTVEGAAGGLGLPILAGWALRGMLVPQWSWGRMTAFSAAIGVSAELGDLACSAYKRIAGVKDSGWIFPGHGGLLDRASSLVFAVVFAYYYT